MPEFEFEPIFEGRLTRSLLDFGQQAVRPFDAAEIAALAMAARPAAVARFSAPPWLRSALLLALLIVMLVAAGVAGGFIRLPSNELQPNPTFVPFSPESFTPLPSDGSAASAPPGSPLVSLVPGSFPPGTTGPGTTGPGTTGPGTTGPGTVVPGTVDPSSPSPEPSPSLAPSPAPSPSLAPSPSPSPEPTLSASPSAQPTRLTVTSAEAGDTHSCAVASDERIYCWGANESGELGDGSTISRFTADVPVVGIDDARSVASGIRFSCAIRGAGTVWCWGEDPGSDASSNIPFQVPDISDATAITAGGAFACALRAGRDVACWGNGQAGQLGNGVYENNSGVPIPQAVVGIDSARAIASGWNHTCALLADRTIWCWGANGDGATAFGPLGDGSSEVRSSTPVQVADIDDAVAIAAGGWSTCAIRAGGDLWCWGHGERGTLGDGNAANSFTPVRVVGIDDARLITVDRWHACAQRSDGTTWCWGDVRWGDLDPALDRLTPVEGRRTRDSVLISTGRNLLLVDPSGRLWQWGFGSVNVPEELPVGAE